MCNINWNDVAEEMRKARELPRKYASFFQWHKKEVKELYLCTQFVRHLQKEGEEGISRITEGSDPPDCVITQAGSEIGVEITELVNQESIEEQVKNDLAYVIGPEWTSNQLTEKLNEILFKKDNPAKKNELRQAFNRYILLIHTDEDELNISTFSRLLDQSLIAQTTLIDEAYILFSFDPQLGRLPVVRII